MNWKFWSDKILDSSEKLKNFYCLLDPSPFWIFACWRFFANEILRRTSEMKIPGKYTITLDYPNLFNEMIHFDHDSLSTFMRLTHLWQIYLVTLFCNVSIENWKGSVCLAVHNSCWWQKSHVCWPFLFS